MQEPDELLDLFDEHEHLLRVISRVDYYKEKAKHAGYLRSAELLIMNDQGELWIPRRSPGRQIWPNGLDYSCGGHVMSGESYKQGCLREAEEELGLHLGESDIELIYTTTPGQGSPWFRKLYLYRSNQVPAFNKNDFSEFYWLTPHDLINRLEAGELAKESLLPTLRAMAGKFWCYCGIIEKSTRRSTLMSLDPAYQSMYNHAKDLQFQVHDALDDPNHPSAHVLRNEMQHLQDELEQRKNPRDIENRIKTIQHTMLEARSNPHSFMSFNDADRFHHTYEDMRQNVRKFSDYS